MSGIGTQILTCKCFEKLVRSEVSDDQVTDRHFLRNIEIINWDGILKLFLFVLEKKQYI